VPLPEEDVPSYGTRRKRDRLNERAVIELLARLGASPWSESFYATGERLCFVLRRLHPPDTIIRRRASEVVRAG
jgi:hypothetical protein